MKISIITPTFNSSKTLRNTLKSIYSQSYQNIEHIIVDGASKDDTLKIISDFEFSNRVVVSESDNGLYDAMNKGIQKASGDIIGILNSDDFYTDNNVLADVYNCFKDNPSAEGVYADLVYINPRENNKEVRHWKAGPFNPSNFYKGWMPPHPTVFLRRSVYQKAGLFNQNLRSSADYEFLLRACLVHDTTLIYLPRVIVHMQIGGVSNASFKNRWRANAEDRMAWEINQLKGGLIASILKPVRKIVQFK